MLNRITGIRLGLLCVVILAVTIRIFQYRHDPEVFLLIDEPPAKWVRPDAQFSLFMHRRQRIGVLYRCQLTLKQPVEDAILTVRAFRTCQVWIDQDPNVDPPMFRTADNLAGWKDQFRFSIPGPISAGEHQITVRVENFGSHPCLLAYSPQLSPQAPFRWQLMKDAGEWVDAADADKHVMPEFHGNYPTIASTFLTTTPAVILIFITAWCGLALYRRRALLSRGGLPLEIPATHVRMLVLGCWVVLAINNVWKVPKWLGFDLNDHLEYIKFICANYRLPLATDGPQTFQSPLFYMVAAPFYAYWNLLFYSEGVVQALRFISLACGMAQIELVYRAAREVFPSKERLQCLATVIGGLMPVNIYMSHAVSNEPFAACLTSLVIVLCYPLMMRPQQNCRLRYFAGLGMVWGAAILAKVTALLLAPLILAVLLVHGRISGRSLARVLASMSLSCGACGLTCGWFFVRNYLSFGLPFAPLGGWDPKEGLTWWQSPGYRQPEQFLTFGESLAQPVYSGVWSFWDGLYSSMWADGWMSGSVAEPKYFPWNLALMHAGIWLALLPMGCVLIGIVAALFWDQTTARCALLFSVAGVAIYLAAVLDLYIRIPIYCSAKSSYMLGMLPCFAILAARGAEPFLRWSVSRDILTAGIICWAVITYSTYFLIT